MNISNDSVIGVVFNRLDETTKSNIRKQAGASDILKFLDAKITEIFKTTKLDSSANEGRIGQVDLERLLLGETKKKLNEWLDSKSQIQEFTERRVDAVFNEVVGVVNKKFGGASAVKPIDLVAGVSDKKEYLKDWKIVLIRDSFVTDFDGFIRKNLPSECNVEFVEFESIVGNKFKPNNDPKTIYFNYIVYKGKGRLDYNDYRWAMEKFGTESNVKVFEIGLIAEGQKDAYTKSFEDQQQPCYFNLNSEYFDKGELKVICKNEEEATGILQKHIEDLVEKAGKEKE